MILGVALTQEDAARGRPDDDCAILEPDGTVAWGGQSWPDYESWLAAMDERRRR